LTKATATSEVLRPPAGFEPYPAISPFMALLGPLWARQETDGGISIGLWIRNHHLNQQQAVHGGMTASLADNAMGYHAACASGGSVVTVHLSVDYMARVTEGNWLEVCSGIDRRGKKLLFASCTGMAGQQAVFRASAVFAAIGR
jgi:uncharacterized protein (TIGR00369 family)